MNILNQGEVVSVRGSIVDARFTVIMPKIHNLLLAGEDVAAIAVGDGGFDRTATRQRGPIGNAQAA